MYNFPLRKAMKETYKCNKDKSQSISSTNKSSNRDEGTNEFGHGALHRAVINDEERTIQRYAVKVYTSFVIYQNENTRFLRLCNLCRR